MVAEDIEKQFSELHREMVSLSCRVAVMESGKPSKYNKRLNAKEAAAIIAEDSLWPVCKNKICRKKIPFDLAKHQSVGRWLRRSYCSRRCVTVATNQKLLESHPPKICGVCSGKFARSFSESVSNWKSRNECYRCNQLPNHYGTIKPGFSVW